MAWFWSNKHKRKYDILDLKEKFVFPKGSVDPNKTIIEYRVYYEDGDGDIAYTKMYSDDKPIRAYFAEKKNKARIEKKYPNIKNLKTSFIDVSKK